MYGRTVGVACFAACALSATALLIPTDLSPKYESAADLSVISSAYQRHQLQLFPCSECASSFEGDLTETGQGDDEVVWIQGGANSIAVNFTISHDRQSLEVNGEPIYPFGLQLENALTSSKIYVHQVPSQVSLEEIESGKAPSTPLEVTGYGVAMHGETVVSDDGNSLAMIKFSIFELDRRPVTPYAVEVALLQTTSGDLSIYHMESVSRPQLSLLPLKDLFSAHGDNIKSSHSDEVEDVDDVEDVSAQPQLGHHESHQHGECGMLPRAVCRLRHMIAAKVKGMKKGGCHGRKHGKTYHGKLPGHIRPHFLRPGHEEPAHGHHHGHDGGHHQGHQGGRPHHMRPHGQHHHHHGHHRHHFFHAFSRGLATVLIPTMAGVAVGMMVSLIGLVVGRLIGFLWIKFYRGGRRGHASVAVDERDASTVSGEKEGLLAVDDEKETEDLPVYEEAPAYADAVGEQK